MKKIFTFGLVSILFGCQNFPTMTFDMSNEVIFDLNKTGLVYSGFKTMDPTSNDDFEKNINKINSIEVTRLTYTITDFAGKDTQIANANFNVINSQGNNSVNFGSFSNLNIKEKQNVEMDLPFEASASQLISKVLC
jgi:hypothetical protein